MQKPGPQQNTVVSLPRSAARLAFITLALLAGVGRARIRYEGELGDDLRPHGQGAMTWPDIKKHYEGQFRNGKPCGQGAVTYPSGSTYEGEFRNGKCCGQGARTFSNGTYEGEWRDDKINGRGSFKWSDGDTYEGEWRDDKQHGRGTLTYSDGDTYEGEWRDGKMHGRGSYKCLDGETYEKEYKNGKMHGRGTSLYPDGATYEGDWRDGKRNGLGKYIYLDGTVKYWGQWENDEPCGPNLKDFAECAICQDRPATHACVPCGHQCVCDNEGEMNCHLAQQEICPKCRKATILVPIAIHSGSVDVKCRICGEKATHACIPCGHQCVCEKHAKKLEKSRLSRFLGKLPHCPECDTVLDGDVTTMKLWK